MKKFLCMLLACTFLLPIFCVQVYAEAPVVRIKEGKINFQTTVTAATSTIRYKTVGWTIRRDNICTSNSTGKHCNPKGSGSASIEGLTQVAQYPDPAIPGKPLTTFFEIPESTVTKALTDVGMEGIQQNDQLYLYAIMIVTKNDQKIDGPFYTLDQIKSAQNWGHPDDLDPYFGIPVTYDSPDFPVDAVCKTEAGTAISAVACSVHKGNFKAGDIVDHTFKETIQSGNKSYQIVRSYISTKNTPGSKYYNRQVGESNLLDRHVKVYLSGIDIVAEYKELDESGEEPPTGGASGNAEVMDPSVTGVIKADQRGSEKFDVLKGIPTSESLYANALSKAYLYRKQFTEMSGTQQYPIQVSNTYTLTWTETRSGPPDADGNPTTISVPRSDTQTVTKSYSIERKYSYWIINRLEVYGIQKTDFTNFALPSGKVTVQPNGYTPPNVSATHDASLDAHITHPVYSNVTLPGQTISGGSSRPSVPNEDWKSDAEKAIGKIMVKNDSFVFNGTTVMDNRTVEEKAPTPGAIPAPPMIGQDVLYGKGYMIDSGKVNKANQPSSATIFYSLVKGINGGANQTFPINGINTVTVHTPVVNYASVSDDKVHNQKTKPTSGRSALILERPFTVTVPTSGQHQDITGYGNRDYSKYTKDKQVWFPFDVYSGDKSTCIPKETWTSIPVGQAQMTFFLPVWVDEGNYDVLFRTFAENSPPSSFGTQMNANLEVTNHVATQVVPVEVIGRLYDFRITDIADYNWETVFRTQKGSAASTGDAYWVGMKGIDGATRGNPSSFVLPVRQGSHPDAGKKNVAVKTGYHIKVDMKTKGNMFGSGDSIRITPTFYFVDSKGKNRQEVDLYYHSGNKKFIRIGSSDDVERRNVTLDIRLRNVPQQELNNTASSLWSLNGGSGTKQAFIDQYLKDVKKPTNVGGYDIILLPQQLRTFIGSMNAPSSVNTARANASVQKWYGEYSMPAAAFIVPKGFNLAEYGRTNRLDDNSPIFLKDGYIIVNFNIETIRNRDLNNPHLQYIYGPLNNQWQMEGFQRSFTDPYGMTFQLKDGDIVFYHANLSSYDDFGSGGTH